MVDRVCTRCGAALAGLPDDSREIVCPLCGERLRFQPPSPEAVRQEPTRAAIEAPVRADADFGNATVFQPRVALAGLLEVAATDSAAASTAGSSGPFVPPPLTLDAEAFFLVLGAAPGRERIRLTRARTVFGRAAADADVELDDPGVSRRHFQIEVMGREFFIRDLASRHGTLLNGRKVRYMELLPGDEVQVGKTVLVFRLRDDGLSRRTA